jgi:gluconate 2-dehydrogenase gamma chain
MQAGASVAQVAGASAQAPAAGFRVLTQPQVATLEAISEQIIPSDRDPGAREAGAVRYIDRALAGEQAYRVPHYTAGLMAIDQTSKAMFGRAFVDLPFDQQTSVLKAVEQGKASPEIWKKVSSTEFFTLVWNHVLEGFYGSPVHGGNKNYVSWKMVGFPEHSGTM